MNIYNNISVGEEKAIQQIMRGLNALIDQNHYEEDPFDILAVIIKIHFEDKYKGENIEEFIEVLRTYF